MLINPACEGLSEFHKLVTMWRRASGFRLNVDVRTYDISSSV